MTKTRHAGRSGRYALVLSIMGLLGATTACGESGTGATGGLGGSGASGSGSGASGQGGAGGMGQGGTGGEGGELFPSGVGGAGGGAGGGGPSCNPILKATVRDFQVAHPDFEDFLGDDKGIVADELGADGKPVYAGNPTTPTTTGKENFDQWYNDVAGVNIAIPVEIPLMAMGGGTYTYNNSAFFPIDGQGFGDEFNTHNYHFTLELRTQFIYEGGEVFTFTGDDDLFTFINGKKVIDLGGVHGAQTSTVDLDARAAELGIEKGKTYPLDFFFAERHTSESNFRIDTTIGCFSEPPIPE
ncbi:fibro-slime domain-containing protein [Polyangium sp. 15x6]|uniref:fibro-slime domain-containing protein n=1 Tax=Polyangium sp. 15x6 TaxID=3042687 RepID=UPI00249A4D38|nr:fibro-slime domain-containing protein [Polyangium sp. 15x6]MDI3285844.1 fibro-slime domain-containing protein [Polyangium sp. 15x6]